MIKCLAIDDEPLALQQLSTFIEKIPFLELVASCRSAVQARGIMEKDIVDAIFIDINMPDLNGMDFVKSLAVPPLVVFTTAYSEYAVEGYKVEAVDYLLKPFGMNDFQRAALRLKERVERFAEQRGEGDEDTLFLKTEYRVVRISKSDIRYVEGMSEYLKIHLEGQQKPLVVLLSMKKIEENLPQNTFMRIHRSYIVNLKKIREVNKNRVIMDADTYLPIGDNYKENFSEWLQGRFLGK